MKFIDKNIVPIPNILLEKGVGETEKNIDLYKNNPKEYSSDTVSARSKDCAKSLDIDPNIYGHEEVKELLIKLHNKSCCYCESRVTNVAYGDIEHFRPKLGYRQDEDDNFHKPGYFWLAYDWNNLLFSCQICNQKYKKNYFPLKDSSKRCNPSKTFDVSQEEPLLINPSIMDPSLHIKFDDEIPVGITEEGETSIKVLGLDREELNEERREVLNKLLAIKELYKYSIGSEREEISKDIFYKELDEALNINGKYSLMIRNHFEKYINEFNL